MKMFKISNQNKNVAQCQLGRPLERILEEANLSGELYLNNRKLKDFPKISSKYYLSDTVTADLSRNKLSEWPEELSTFAFMESLHLYHNSIRTINGSSVVGLTSLTLLDLRSNQLITLPRQLCFLPIQVLLISNNRLISLPDELGRMEKLTDLDASCNQINSLPVRIGDLRQLSSLSLRNNQLVYFPREITLLTLIKLDISNNKISSLPIELKQMNTLVEFNLENNPLTFPPANLCVRGQVHIFKFLETQAQKNEKSKNGSNNNHNGSSEYGTMKRITKQMNPIDIQIDSIYSIKNGFDKPVIQANHTSKREPKEQSLQNVLQAGNNNKKETREINLYEIPQCDQPDAKIDDDIEQKIILKQNGQNSSGEIINSNEKNKNFENIQTYREYKEALKQQRSHEILNVYKHRIKLDNDANSNLAKLQAKPPNGQNGTKRLETKKYLQKTSHSESTSPTNDLIDYLKPKSPLKFNNNESNKILSPPSSSSSTPTNSFNTKIRRNVTWNEAIPAGEKLSFTMRREFDRQKEETELLTKLRNIIETRLKMKLPDDISAALMDGVILCHLANAVRPRSVASIHVPSPGVPHLTMARCRRNVDNFLDACRRLGIDENLICCAADVLEGKGAVQVAITVTELFRVNANQLLDNNKSPIRLHRANSAPNT